MIESFQLDFKGTVPDSIELVVLQEMVSALEL